MTAIRVIFDGKAFIPQEPVSLPIESEALVLVDGADAAMRADNVDANGWPIGYFEQVVGSMPEMERDPQGNFEIRLPLE